MRKCQMKKLQAYLQLPHLHFSYLQILVKCGVKKVGRVKDCVIVRKVNVRITLSLMLT